MSLDYRQMAVDQVGEERVRQAESAGVPVPFWEVSYKVRSTNGRHGELRMQFESQEEAAGFAGRPSGPGEPLSSPAIQAIMDIIGGLPVSADGGLSVCFDPRSWDGGPVAAA